MDQTEVPAKSRFVVEKRSNFCDAVGTIVSAGF
jgi:hypothetical protein